MILKDIFQNEEAVLKFAQKANLFYDGGECKNAPQCKGHYEIGRKNSARDGLILWCPFVKM